MERLIHECIMDGLKTDCCKSE